MNPHEIVLLIIDFPDERAGNRAEFAHMHAWGSRAEMEMLKRLLLDQFGFTRVHEITEDRICYRCGAMPSRRYETSPE